MPPRTRRPKKTVKPTSKPSATPSPPPDPDLVTPQVPESRGIRVFTEQETLYFSSSSKASASKLDPVLPGQGPVKVTDLPKSSGSMRSKIALRGQDGERMSQVRDQTFRRVRGLPFQALDQTKRMTAFMEFQAVSLFSAPFHDFFGTRNPSGQMSRSRRRCLAVSRSRAFPTFPNPCSHPCPLIRAPSSVPHHPCSIIRAPSSVLPHPCPPFMPICCPTSVPIQTISHSRLDALYAYTSGSSSSGLGGKVYGTLAVENIEPSWLTWLGSPVCYNFAQLTVCASAEYID